MMEPQDKLREFMCKVTKEFSSPVPGVYLNKQYPCHRDQVISSLIELYIKSELAERMWIASQLGNKYWSTLTVYAERMAIWAVRLKQPELILKGLLALALDDGRFDPRENILIMAPLYHSATKLGLDPKPLFLQTADIAGPCLGPVLRAFPDRPESNRDLASMGYIEQYTSEGFTYKRNW